MPHVTHCLFFIMREGKLVVAKWSLVTHIKYVMFIVVCLCCIFYSSRLFACGPDTDVERDIGAFTAWKSLRQSRGGSKMAAVAAAQPAVKTKKWVNEVSWPKSAVTHRSNHRFSPGANLQTTTSLLDGNSYICFFYSLVTIVDYHDRWLQDNNLADPWRLSDRGRPRRQSCCRFHETI